MAADRSSRPTSDFRVALLTPRPIADTVFITTSGSRVRSNVVPMVFRLGEGTYCAGMLAAGLSRGGRLGFVGEVKLPPVEGTYLGFVGGAKAVCPDVEVIQANLDNFEDVAAAKENAPAQIRWDADVLLHNADAASFGVFQAARESPGVLAIGANRGQNGVAPDVIVALVTLDVPHAPLAVARDWIIAGTLRVPSAEFVPDSVPVARR